MVNLKFRQVHLDFHTPGNIDGIGKKFDPDEFKLTLQKGHVDSITLFSKCHHGYSYHPTKANEIHPHLEFDLLGEQLRACKEIGVNAPVYISAGLDEKDANIHPEWLYRNKDESLSWGVNFIEEAAFHLLCFNTGYMDKLIAQIEEVMKLYNPSGIFLDIVGEKLCYCASCRNDMIKSGLNPLNISDVKIQGKKVFAEYTAKVEKAVRKYSKDTTIFHNSGHISRGRKDLIKFQTHLELESLPTGGWGYDHFPHSASYARTTGKDFLGMTGKFHTMWGEFGGYKHPNALIYETCLSLALGGKCSIGDQLHPNGKLDVSTYELIGKAYEQVENKEKWCKNVEAIADMAMISYEAFANLNGLENDKFIDTGLSRILLEGKYLFNSIDPDDDFRGYKLIIFPDKIYFDEEMTSKVKNYVQQGGRVLLTGTSGTDKDNKKFMIDTGALFMGKNEFSPTYMIPEKPLTNGIASYVMYGKNYEIKTIDGEILAQRQNPYFNRTPLTFMSHQHAANNPDSEQTYPGACRKDNVSYISWNVFTDYATKGSLQTKEFVVGVIDDLLGEDKTLVTDLPDRGVVTLQYDKENNRYINHLLFAYTSVRGKDIEVIEDALPLYEVNVKLKLKAKPSKLYIVPEMDELSFDWDGDSLSYTVPKVEIHQMIVIE